MRSLRMRPDELFVACDGEGTDYICRLGARGASFRNSHKASQPPQSEIACSIAEIVDTRPSLGEPSVDCGVFIALAKGERLDYAVQKSVELGARDIVLFPSDRCVSLPDDMTKKIARLQRIALETAKQCGRGRVPQVSSAVSFASAVRQAARYGLQPAGGDPQPAGGGSPGGASVGPGAASVLPLFFYEEEGKLHLKQALERHFRRGPHSATHGLPSWGAGAEGGARVIRGAVALVTGPEGGFEPHEAEFARSAGLVAVSLGPRILRCETAPAAALAAVMFFTGNL